MLSNDKYHAHYKRVDYSNRSFTENGSRKSLWDHWSDLADRVSTHKPSKKDLSLTALGRALPSIMLRKRIAPKNVEMRIIGEKIDILKLNITAGKNLFDLISTDNHSYTEYLFNNICTNTVGFSIQEEYITPLGEIFLVKSLLLPLSDNEGNTNYVISSHDISTNGFYKGDHRNLEKYQINLIKITPIDLGYGIPG